MPGHYLAFLGGVVWFREFSGSLCSSVATGALYTPDVSHNNSAGQPIYVPIQLPLEQQTLMTI